MFLRLPVDPDEGFPQSFRLASDVPTYLFELHVNVAEEVLPEPDRVAAGARPRDGHGGAGHRGASSWWRWPAQDPAGDARCCAARCPRLVYRAGELLLIFRTMKVALGNLNGIGRFGSEIVAGVAQR